VQKGDRMIRRFCASLPPSLALLLFAGCLYPVREKVDYVVCDLGAMPRDVEPKRPDEPPPSMPPAGDQQTKSGKPAALAKDATLTWIAAEQAAGRDGPSILTRLKLPAVLPGSEAKPLELPPLKPETKAERDRIINDLYPPLEPLGPDPQPLPGPEGRPLTLSDLQRMALEKHPSIRQAAARVEAARGAAIQAGMPPNPIFTPEADTFGTAHAPGYEGFFLEQVIRLPNKLQLARASAAMDLRNAELAQRRAETDLSHQVRGNYFAVLVAQENIKVLKALVEFTTSVYEIQLDQLKVGGFAAAYEPSLLLVSALQARLSLYQARNQYQTAWKTLAASLGRVGLAPTELAGRLDIPVPVYDHAKVLEYALANHTDVRSARNSLLQANYQLRLAQLTPIPDPDVRIGAQKDYTAGFAGEIAGTVSIGFTIPIWDRNQGGIIQAQGNVVVASEQEHLARVNLSTTLTTAFNTYSSNLIAVEMYRKQILPRQVQGYRALYQRYHGEKPPERPAPAGTPTPAFADVFTAQQNLVGYVQAYVAALGALWQSVTDVADVLQTDDLFQMGQEQVPAEALGAVPDLRKLELLPCCHPCAAPDGAVPSDNGAWPSPLPGKDSKTMPRAADEAKADRPNHSTSSRLMPHSAGPLPPKPEGPQLLAPPFVPIARTEAKADWPAERSANSQPVPQAVGPMSPTTAGPQLLAPPLVPTAPAANTVQPPAWPPAYTEPEPERPFSVSCPPAMGAK
jgi:cobalt-zinc-cadmium efflux system outer membrane protein